MKLNYHLYPIVVLVFLLGSCVSKNDVQTNQMEDIDPETLLHTSFSGKQFSIPSPTLTAFLLKEIKTPYQPDILIQKTTVDEMTNEYKRSLCLGVLAADLGYVSFYNDNTKIVNYLVGIEKLTGKLGIENAFNKNFIKRYQDNISNTDSLLHLSSEAFKQADSYLKNNDRVQSSLLILIGGWVESIYIASKIASQSQNEQVITRIGEQKQTVETIISVLIDNAITTNNSELLTAFQNLEKSYQNVAMHYTYSEPSIDMENKVTTFNHEISFEVPAKTLQDIQAKIIDIRNLIVK